MICRNCQSTQTKISPVLASTARERDAMLATADERLVEYDKAGFMRVLDVR
jgi:hypothetical protein